MTPFKLTQTGRVATGMLEYREDDLAFDTIPRPAGASSSLLLNEVELMLDEVTGSLSFVTGYCPFHGWDLARLNPPLSSAGVLLPVLTAGVEPGISHRLDESDERWPVFADPETGWVRLGLGNHQPTEAIHFAPGAIAVLDDKQALTSLWLRPVALPRGFLARSRLVVS